MGSTGRRIWRRSNLLKGGVVFLLFLFVAVYLGSEIIAEIRLRETIAETDRTDPGWRLAELEANRAEISAEQNSAVILENARKLLPSKWPFWHYPGPSANPDREEILKVAESYSKLEPNVLLNNRQLVTLRTELKRAEAALIEISKIRDRPRGRFAIKYPKDFISYRADHLHDARTLADLIAYDLLLRCQDGEIDPAIESCLLLVHVQGAIGDEPVFGVLSRNSIRHLICRKIERVLAQGKPAKARLESMQQVLEAEEAVPLLLTQARSDRGIMDGYMAALQNGDASLQDYRESFDIAQEKNKASWEDFRLTFFPGEVKANRAALLHYSNQIVELAKLPTEQQRIAIAEDNPSAQRLPWLAKHLALNWRIVANEFHRNVGLIRCTVALLASERFRQDNNRWPISLDELVPRYLAKVPTDPFCDGRLRFRKVPAGIAVYSVGQDGKDDGGNLVYQGAKPPTDVGVRGWDIDKRRRSAD